MKIITAFVVGLAFAGALSAAPARAQNRAFVSAGGSDSNACSFVAPCRSLQHAHDTVTANGEIDVLDPAGYGTLIINRAISINGHGYAEILVGSGNGITINATDPTAAINLSGLIVDGQGVGSYGIVFIGGASLTIESCSIRHMTGDGIDFLPTTTATTTVLTMSNSLVTDNGYDGIFVEPNGSAEAVFTRVEVNNNGNGGITVTGATSAGTNTINATAFESVAAGNGSAGFFAGAATNNATTKFMVSHSVSANNVYGAFTVGPLATIRLANSALTGNTNGWGTQAGVIDSYGDNYIDGNASNETAPPKILHK